MHALVESCLAPYNEQIHQFYLPKMLLQCIHQIFPLPKFQSFLLPKFHSPIKNSCKTCFQKSTRCLLERPCKSLDQCPDMVFQEGLARICKSWHVLPRNARSLKPFTRKRQKTGIFMYYKMRALKPQMPENWLSMHASI